MSASTMKFHFFPAPKPDQVLEKDWQNWHWQMQKSVSTLAEIERAIPLTATEKLALTQGSSLFRTRLTPYIVSMIEADPRGPLRRMLIPDHQELHRGEHTHFDPLAERKNEVVPRLIHRYPDRVLLLVTDTCSVYCRYCTRKHFTASDSNLIAASEFLAAFEYIKKHPGIREVILSGGDPLTLSDQQLGRILSGLREIEHVEIIRIGTRMPVVCPQRITPDLVFLLKRYNPVYLMTHFNHPRELTSDAASALTLVADNGIPIFNQMVLLNGINNHPAVVQALCRRLLYLRVKPYYMHQCDPSESSWHLQTPIQESASIQRQLWGNLSGLAMPNLSIDLPGGGGKVGVVPDFRVSPPENSTKEFVGFDGIGGVYILPENYSPLVPIGIEEYQAEWEGLIAAKL